MNKCSCNKGGIKMSKIFVINVSRSIVDSNGFHELDVKTMTAVLKEESKAYKKEVMKKICDDEIAKCKWGKNIKFTYDDNLLLADYYERGICIELIPCELVAL